MIAQNEGCAAMETSAKEADNVENLFMSMATQLKRNIKSAEAAETKDIAADGNPAGITLGGHNICARGPLSCCRIQRRTPNETYLSVFHRYRCNLHCNVYKTFLVSDLMYSEMKEKDCVNIVYKISWF